MTYAFIEDILVSIYFPLMGKEFRLPFPRRKVSSSEAFIGFQL